MHTVTVCDFFALVPHIAAWDRLAWKAPQKSPTLFPSWTDAFLRHRLLPRERWFCSFAYLGSELVGVLPLISSPHPLLGRSSPILRVPSDEFTPSGDVLLARDHAHAALQGLLDEVQRIVPEHLGLDLKAVRSNSPIWKPLESGTGGYVIKKGQRAHYSCLDVSGSFGSYLAGLGKLRGDLKRFRRKLEKRGNVTIEFRHGAGVSDEFFGEFLALEASGWKGRAGTSILSDSRAVAFYSTLASNFSDQQRWEWQAIRVDNRLVAAGMGVRCGEALMLPKFAFDEDFAECRPGSLLTKEIIENAFSRPDVSELNPMSRLDWGCHWRMNCDEYTDVYLVRRSSLPLLFQLPAVTVKSIYQDRVKPRMPAMLKKVHGRFKRRGDRKPRRAADSKLDTPVVTGQ